MRFFENGFSVQAALRQLLAAAFGAVMLTLAACSSGDTKSPNIAYQPQNFGAPDPEVAQAPTPVAQRNGTIAAYDKLSIKVLQVEELSGEFQVNPAGQFSYPLIGTVEAAGKTPTQLAQFIAARLGAKHLRSPNVQVNIMDAEAEKLERTVTIDGSVKMPGAFPVKGPISLMRAVALAQGLSDDANPKRVIVFRQVNGQRLAGGFDLTAIRRAQAEDPTIYPNDIVVVDGRDARLYSTFKEILGTLPILALFRPF